MTEKTLGREDTSRRAEEFLRSGKGRPNPKTIDRRSDPIEALAEEGDSEYESFSANGYEVEMAIDEGSGVSEGAVYREESDYDESELAAFHEVLREIQRPEDPLNRLDIQSPSVTRDAYGNRNPERYDEELDRLLDEVATSPSEVLNSSNPKDWLISTRDEISAQAEEIRRENKDEFDEHTWYDYPDLASNYFTEQVWDVLEGELDSAEYTRFVSVGDREKGIETAEELTQIPYQQRTTLSSLMETPKPSKTSPDDDFYDRNIVVVGENQSLTRMDIVSSPMEGTMRALRGLID